MSFQSSREPFNFLNHFHCFLAKKSVFKRHLTIFKTGITFIHYVFSYRSVMYRRFVVVTSARCRLSVGWGRVSSRSLFCKAEYNLGS